MANFDFDEKYGNLTIREDRLNLVYDILKKSNDQNFKSKDYQGLSVDDIYEELFFLGKYEGKEMKKIEKELKRIEPRGEMYKDHKLHVIRIGNPNSIELWSLDREENFLKTFSHSGKKDGEFNDTEFGIIITLSRLEHQKKSKMSGTKVIPGGWMTLYNVATEDDFIL